jgi:undecaprenyl-diphosphatase
MIEFLQSADTALFRILNGTIANPVFDAVMPVVTDLNRHWYGWILFGGAWLALMTVGGKAGRTAALLLIPVVALSDQISSSVIKHLVMRPTPCHLVGGVPVVEHVRLLVGCGGGFSFPSSHAVNNFAAATWISYFFPRYRTGFYSAAGVVAFSRISVGVHYPSDVIGGALIGVLIAALCLLGWMFVESYFPRLDPIAPPGWGREGEKEGRP